MTGGVGSERTGPEQDGRPASGERGHGEAVGLEYPDGILTPPYSCSPCENVC